MGDCMTGVSRWSLSGFISFYFGYRTGREHTTKLLRILRGGGCGYRTTIRMDVRTSVVGHDLWPLSTVVYDHEDYLHIFLVSEKKHTSTHLNSGFSFVGLHYT